MRVLRIGLVGGFAVALALVMSGIVNGLWPFVLTMTAAFLGASTLGTMAALLVVGSEPTTPLGTAALAPGESRSNGRCGVCRREMHQIGAIWVCRRCDMAASRR